MTAHAALSDPLVLAFRAVAAWAQFLGLPVPPEGPALALQAPPPLVERLQAAAPGVNPKALAMAARAVQCAEKRGIHSEALAVVDFDAPVTARRLYVFSTANPFSTKLTAWEEVAQGEGSSPDATPRFSDMPDSHQSSLGLYQVNEAFVSSDKAHPGARARLDGLEVGWNANVRARAIILHPSAYVREGWAGASQGCFAVRPEVAPELVATLADGKGLLFAYASGEGLEKAPSQTCGRLLQPQTWLAEHPTERGAPAQEAGEEGVIDRAGSKTTATDAGLPCAPGLPGGPACDRLRAEGGPKAAAPGPGRHRAKTKAATRHVLPTA